jgi:hypothetical protein
VIPPIPGDEAKKALDADENRPNKGEKGYLVGLDRHVHAAAIGRHDDGDGAAVRLVREGHGPRSLRARSLNAQLDYQHAPFIDGPGTFHVRGWTARAGT